MPAAALLAAAARVAGRVPTHSDRSTSSGRNGLAVSIVTSSGTVMGTVVGVGAGSSGVAPAVDRGERHDAEGEGNGEQDADRQRR